MKTLAFFLFALLFLCVDAVSQRIQYSRQPVIINFPDATQLITNISGYHHLLSFTYRKKPVVHIFDAQLQPLSTVEVPFKVPDYSEVKFLSLNNYYYMFIQIRRTATYEIWRIDAKGNATSLTTAFQSLVKTHFIKTAGSFQLITNNNRLYIISHTYFPTLQKVETAVANVDDKMNFLSIKKTIYDFNSSAEVLQQVMLLNSNQILVLKNTKNYLMNATLELMKVNLDSGQIVSTTFNSAGNFYSEPSFSYNNSDSTITIYSMIREATPGRVQRSVLVCRLDNALKEKVPLSLLRSQFRNNALASFLLIDGTQPIWIGYSNRVPLRFYNGYNTRGIGYAYSDEPSAVRFTILNKQLKPAGDSLLISDKHTYGIQPQEYAKFAINDKSYLLFNQKFKANRRGLLMVHEGEDKQVEITDVRVNDRFDYLLSQLQVIPGEAVLLPYIHRREAGLVKLTYN